MLEQEVSIEKLFGSNCEYIPESVATLKKQHYKVIGDFNINDQSQVEWALSIVREYSAVGVIIADSSLESDKLKGIYYVVQKPHKDFRKE